MHFQTIVLENINTFYQYFVIFLITFHSCNLEEREVTINLYFFILFFINKCEVKFTVIQISAG